MYIYETCLSVFRALKCSRIGATFKAAVVVLCPCRAFTTHITFDYVNMLLTPSPRPPQVCAIQSTIVCVPI